MIYRAGCSKHPARFFYRIVFMRKIQSFFYVFSNISIFTALIVYYEDNYSYIIVFLLAFHMCICPAAGLFIYTLFIGKWLVAKYDYVHIAGS